MPHKEFADTLKHVKALAVMDKADSVNAMAGPVYTELVTALHKHDIHIPVSNYIYGLGGRDVKAADIEKVFNDLLASQVGKNDPNGTYYLGVRE